MEGHEYFVMPSCSFTNSIGHAPPYGNLSFIPGITVTAHYPYNILPVLIPVADPLTIDCGVLGRKNFRADSPAILKYLVSPRRQQRYIDSELMSFVDDVINMPEIGFSRACRVI